MDRHNCRAGYPGRGCTRDAATPRRQQEGPLAVGDAAPAFTLESASGGPVSLLDGAWMNQMWWAMWIPSVLILGALLALGIWAVRRFSEPRGDSSARRILEERFARGEIDADEFRSRLAALERRG